jgi:hypothetical protein
MDKTRKGTVSNLTLHGYTDTADLSLSQGLPAAADLEHS